MDPMVLFGSESVIREAVGRTIANAGGRRHILNVGHGVVQAGSKIPLFHWKSHGENLVDSLQSPSGLGKGRSSADILA